MNTAMTEPDTCITPTRRFAATSPLKGEVERSHPSGETS